MYELMSFLVEHPPLLILASVAGVAGFILWLVKPPTWKDLDKSDFPTDDDDTFVNRLWRGRRWFRWW